MSADLIIEGDHALCADLTKAADPATWGQAIEVPDLIAKFDGFFPEGMVPTSVEGMDAARMLTPGAIISGYCKSKTLSEIIHERSSWSVMPKSEEKKRIMEIL